MQCETKSISKGAVWILQATLRRLPTLEQQVVPGVPGIGGQHLPLPNLAEKGRTGGRPIRRTQLRHQHPRLHLHERAVQERGVTKTTC